MQYQINSKQQKSDYQKRYRLSKGQGLKTHIHETDKHNVVDIKKKQRRPDNPPWLIVLSFVINHSDHESIILAKSIKVYKLSCLIALLLILTIYLLNIL